MSAERALLLVHPLIEHLRFTVDDLQGSREMPALLYESSGWKLPVVTDPWRVYVLSVHETFDMYMGAVKMKKKKNVSATLRRNPKTTTIGHESQGHGCLHHHHPPPPPHHHRPPCSSLRIIGASVSDASISAKSHHSTWSQSILVGQDVGGTIGGPKRESRLRHDI
jgi:hypothetical protein